MRYLNKPYEAAQMCKLLNLNREDSRHFTMCSAAGPQDAGTLLNPLLLTGAPSADRRSPKPAPAGAPCTLYSCLYSQ